MGRSQGWAASVRRVGHAFDGFPARLADHRGREVTVCPIYAAGRAGSSGRNRASWRAGAGSVPGGLVQELAELAGWSAAQAFMVAWRGVASQSWPRPVDPLW